ncbi:MAG: hypothetical protein ABR501_13320 [Pyrinomonadaceae bacterium]
MDEFTCAAGHSDPDNTTHPLQAAQYFGGFKRGNTTADAERYFPSVKIVFQGFVLATYAKLKINVTLLKQWRNGRQAST